MVCEEMRKFCEIMTLSKFTWIIVCIADKLFSKFQNDIPIEQ
jgi:hypothetical protein